MQMHESRSLHGRSKETISGLRSTTPGISPPSVAWWSGAAATPEVLSRLFLADVTYIVLDIPVVKRYKTCAVSLPLCVRSGL